MLKSLLFCNAITFMEAIIQEIEAEKLLPLCDIPKEIWNSRVEVTIRPIENTPRGTPMERIEQIRKKYNRDVFIDQLKEQVAKGHPFDFDVQKVIDETETEEEAQARYRLEKQTWGKAIG
jgi:hypothetical protein